MGYNKPYNKGFFHCSFWLRPFHLAWISQHKAPHLPIAFLQNRSFRQVLKLRWCLCYLISFVPAKWDKCFNLRNDINTPPKKNHETWGIIDIIVLPTHINAVSMWKPLDFTIALIDSPQNGSHLMIPEHPVPLPAKRSHVWWRQLVSEDVPFGKLT